MNERPRARPLTRESPLHRPLARVRSILQPEPHLRGPVWEDAAFLANLHNGVRASSDEINRNRDLLLAELRTLGAEIQTP
jgi:hypothetical protein